jgi:hypothetical protein
MEDEMSRFLAEVGGGPKEKVLPKKRGLPSAYANRGGMFESVDAKTRRIEKEAQSFSGVVVDSNLMSATICAAPVRNV